MRHTWTWIGIVALALSGCGGGGGGGGDGGGGTPGGSTPPTFDATGRWVAHATGSFTNPAGEEEQDSAAEVDVTQTGNDVSIAEVAEVLGVSPRTVDTEWRADRAWLRRELG